MRRLWYSFLILFLLSLAACDINPPVEAKPNHLIAAEKVEAQNGEIVLCAECPPGFERTKKNTCELRSPYLQYASLQNKGVGGLKTALPEYRDGFSPQQIDLGRYLFFDPILSGDGSLSCASCHQPDKGFSDGQKRSIGRNGIELERAAPSLWNMAFLKRFFWDARAASLEEQMQGPLFDAHEMNNTPQNLQASLNAAPTYRRLFSEAFDRTPQDPIQLEEVYLALTAFQTSLISLNSRYDHYVHGYHEALTPEEIEGFNIYRSFVARCSECHTPPLFTNQQIAVIGAPEADGRALDPGAGPVLNEPSLRAGFKVPSLRNVALTPPYMHSGAFSTLRETVAFYTNGRGHAVPEGEDLKLHWHIWEPKLTDYELDRLVDFLHTLTDESFKPRTPDILPSGIEVSRKLLTDQNTSQ